MLQDLDHPNYSICYIINLQLQRHRQMFKGVSGCIVFSLSSLLSRQSRADQFADSGEHSRPAVIGRQHLHHLLCGGSFSETRARET